MVEINTQEEDRLIKKYEDEIKSLTKKDYYVDDVLAMYTKDTEKERIRKIERLEDQIAEQKRMKVLKATSNESKPNIQSMKLWDIIIIPWICFILGNFAMSDYNTYDNMRKLFEKGVELYITKDTPKPKSPLLADWQFSSGLKFLYAVVRYINTKQMKQQDGICEIHTDKDFASYFKDAGRYFDFINKENSDLTDKTLDYWKGPRNYCKKILSRCSNKISIDSKEWGKKWLWFYVRYKK